MKRKHVTITQVARAAGVSPATVSFAFNNPEQLGSETTERVRAIARDMGYSPSPIARAMISRRTGVIGLLVPLSIHHSFQNPFIPEFIQGVGEVCDAHSLSVLVVSPYEGSLEEATRRAPVDAYIVLGLNENHEEIEPLRRRQVPFVIVDGDADTVSSINVDDEGGAYAAASHLLSRGHRDILVVCFPWTPNSSRSEGFYGVGDRRLHGYGRALAECGLRLDFDRLAQARTSIDGGAAAFRQAWQNGERPTAVLATSDVKALGVIREAHQMGLRVPDDLEVIGFDDIPLAALTQPALTTVRQPIVEKGRQAAQLLIADLEENRLPEKVLLETELVLRQSTRTASTRTASTRTASTRTASTWADIHED